MVEIRVLVRIDNKGQIFCISIQCFGKTLQGNIGL